MADQNQDLPTNNNTNWFQKYFLSFIFPTVLAALFGWFSARLYTQNQIGELKTRLGQVETTLNLNQSEIDKIDILEKTSISSVIDLNNLKQRTAVAEQASNLISLHREIIVKDTVNELKELLESYQ